MRRGLLLSLTLVLVLQGVSSRVWAGDPDAHEFPGTGSRTAWEQANAFYIQGVHATRSNQVDESIVFYRKAIALYADDPDFQINLGVSLEDKGNYKEAETVLLHALTLVPQNWSVSYNLGNVDYAQRKYQDAVNFWTRSMALSPPEHFKQKAASNIAAVNKQYLSKGHK